MNIEGVVSFIGRGRHTVVDSIKFFDKNVFFFILVSVGKLLQKTAVWLMRHIWIVSENCTGYVLIRSTILWIQQQGHALADVSVGLVMPVAGEQVKESGVPRRRENMVPGVLLESTALFCVIFLLGDQGSFVS